MNGETILGGTEAARLRIGARTGLLPAVLAFVSEVAAQLGLQRTEQEQFRLIVEQACINVVDALEPGQNASYDVVVEQWPGKLIVAVEDEGPPLRQGGLQESAEPVMQKGQEQRSPSRLSELLMKDFADEVVVLNRGKHGRRVELVKELPVRSIEEELVGFPEPQHEGRDISADIPLTVRMLRPDKEDAVALSRCVFQSYGYSYLSDFLYYPQKIQELIESGGMASCVAVTPDDEIVGHLSLRLERTGAKVGKTGQAVVDPRVRGRNIFRSMKEYLAAEAAKRGMIGFYSETPTIHQFTQKGNLALGGHETGLLLSYMPSSLGFNRIEQADEMEELSRLRQTSLIYYVRIAREQEREVYCPEHHRDMLAQIYSESLIQRSICTGAYGIYREHSEMDLVIRPDWGRATIRVRRSGGDLHSIVQQRLRQLCNTRIECIYADLPLDDPETASSCQKLERLGFFFAGVIPELRDGDVLRLQYVNSRDSDSEKICLVSHFAKELYGYVMAEKKRVAGL